VFDKEIMCMKFDKEGSIIAAGLENGYVYIYNPYNGKIISNLVLGERILIKNPFKLLDYFLSI